MKTKSGAKKRFKVTGTGKVVFKQAHSRHRLISKPQKMKRKARGTAVMFHSDGVKVLDYFLVNAGAKRRRSRPYLANDNEVIETLPEGTIVSKSKKKQKAAKSAASAKAGE